MSAPISKFLDGLKKHLRDNESCFHWVDSWCGDTESGFHDEDRFDFDALLKQIDEFSASFKKP